MTDQTPLFIHTDGASRGNPGQAAFAYVIERGDEVVAEDAGRLGVLTNNQAEYQAVVRALKHALEISPEGSFVVHSDSELMVKQLNGEYRVKNEELRPLYEEAREMAGRFRGSVTFKHVRREFNKRADQLCNEVLDGKRVSERPIVSGMAQVASKKPKIEPARDEQPAPTTAPVPDDLHSQALACLRTASESWQRGERELTPQEVWGQLTAILHRHWVGLITPPHRPGP